MSRVADIPSGGGPSRRGRRSEVGEYASAQRNDIVDYVFPSKRPVQNGLTNHVAAEPGRGELWIIEHVLGPKKHEVRGQSPWCPVPSHAELHSQRHRGCSVEIILVNYHQ